MSDEATPEPNEDVSELRKAAEGGKAAKLEAELAKKELAFVKAGIDTDSKPAQALLKAYDGELSADAIKAEAAEWGLLKQAEPEPEATPDYTADAELQNMRDASAGEPAPIEPPNKSAFDIAGDQFLQDRKDGRPQQDAMNRAYGTFLKEAAKGNPTAIFNEDEWERTQEEYGHGAEFARG